MQLVGPFFIYTHINCSSLEFLIAHALAARCSNAWKPGNDYFPLNYISLIFLKQNIVHHGTCSDFQKYSVPYASEQSQFTEYFLKILP